MTDIQKIDFSNGKEGLAEAVQNNSGHFAFSTSLGAEDQVITHFIAEKNIDIRYHYTVLSFICTVIVP